MENLLSAQAKLKAIAQLPQPEYVAVARIILEDINKELAEYGAWREHYKIEMSAKFLETIIRIADSENSMTYSFGEYSYEVSGKKQKVKK